MRSCHSRRRRQKQTFVSGVAYQRVLETETPFQTAPFGKDDTRRDQLRQRGLKLRRRHPRHDRIEQRKAELPADDGGDLRHLARRAEAVEPRHQRILERRRHRGAVFARRFHHAFGQFLGEQRNAVGLGDDRGDGFRRQAVRAATPATNWAHSARPRRPSVSSVECGRACHGGAKSGRAVTTASNAHLTDAVGQMRHQFERGGDRSSGRLPRPGAPDRSRPSGRSRRPEAQWSPPCVAPA